MGRESDMRDGQVPTFIGIGMPNSGTRWIYDQLSKHRDVWMPCQKELHFFDRGMRFKSARKRLYRNLLRSRRDGVGRDYSIHAWLQLIAASRLESTQVRFLIEYLLGPGAERRAAIEAWTQWRRETGEVSMIENPGLEASDFDNYRRLFHFHDRPVCGEITPAYASLHSEYVQEICSHFPRTRFVAVVRDPIERQVSALRKHVRKGWMSKAGLLERVATEPYSQQYLSRMDPCAVADRWTAAAGEDRFMAVRFKDLVERPRETRDRLAEFIGLPSGARGFSVRPDFNRKRDKKASENLTDEERRFLESRISSDFAEAAKRFQERFGD